MNEKADQYIKVDVSSNKLIENTGAKFMTVSLKSHSSSRPERCRRYRAVQNALSKKAISFLSYHQLPWPDPENEVGKNLQQGDHYPPRSRLPQPRWRSELWTKLDLFIPLTNPETVARQEYQYKRRQTGRKVCDQTLAMSIRSMQKPLRHDEGVSAIFNGLAQITHTSFAMVW